jgi:hypothetical protein
MLTKKKTVLAPNDSAKWDDHIFQLVGEGVSRLTSLAEGKRRIDAIAERIPIETGVRSLTQSLNGILISAYLNSSCGSNAEK